GRGQVNSGEEPSQLGHRQLDARPGNAPHMGLGIKLLEGAGFESLVPDHRNRAGIFPGEGTRRNSAVGLDVRYNAGGNRTWRRAFHSWLERHRSTMAVQVTRLPLKLRPDPRRVITRFFRPGDNNRVRRIIDRALAIPEPQVEQILDLLARALDRRHPD